VIPTIAGINGQNLWAASEGFEKQPKDFLETIPRIGKPLERVRPFLQIPVASSWIVKTGRELFSRTNLISLRIASSHPSFGFSSIEP